LAGYVGSPRLATAARGALVDEATSKGIIDYALKVLDGFDERQLPRWGDVSAKIPATVSLSEPAVKRETEIKQKEQAWLAKHGLH
jgi:hypothetical protein